MLQAASLSYNCAPRQVQRSLPLKQPKDNVNTTKKPVNIGLLLGVVLVSGVIVAFLSWYVTHNQPAVTVSKQKIVPAQMTGFEKQVQQMVASYTVRFEDSIPVVHPPAGSDVYLLARNYSWGNFYIELERGQPYRLHLASQDMRHAIVIHELRLMYRIKPDEFKVVSFTPQKSGRFQIFCGEWCGIGHASMTGRLLVTDQNAQN